MLAKMMFHQWIKWIHSKFKSSQFNNIQYHKFLKLIPDIGSAVHVWVKVNIIGMQMVLYHMLMNPVYLRSTNPVLSDA